MMSHGFQWLLTYLLHSSVLLGSAAVLDWRRRLTARGMSSALWRIALFGGFVSASLQPELQGLFASTSAGAGSQYLIAEHSLPALELPASLSNAIDVAPLLVPVWLCVGLGGLVYLSVRLVRLIRDTARMSAVTSPGAERSACELALHARVRLPPLRSGAHLQAPLLAPGGTICIPAWMLDRYESRRLTAALAHEMAHLRRHDNAWRIAARVAAIVAWVQPLNRLAIRRMDESAELACDAWAAAATGLRRELALSLEDCAVRLGASPPHPALALGMAASRSAVLERVTKLLEDPAMNTGLKRAARWSSAALLVIAAVAAFIVVSTLSNDVPPRWLAASSLYQSLRNIDQDVHRSRSIVVKSPQRYVYVQVTENFSMSAQNRAQAQTGKAVIAEQRDGVTRSVRYERGAAGQLLRTYKVDGRVRALDADGARWLETMMPIAAPALAGS
jgi:beta-lactamase regulating signal transducer with metallopeptidase domain